MTPEDQYRLDIDMVDFYAERNDDDPNLINFVTEGGGIFVKAKLHMKDVIILREFLEEEIEDWLNS